MFIVCWLCDNFFLCNAWSYVCGTAKNEKCMMFYGITGVGFIGCVRIKWYVQEVCDVLDILRLFDWFKIVIMIEKINMMQGYGRKRMMIV